MSAKSDRKITGGKIITSAALLGLYIFISNTSLPGQVEQVDENKANRPVKELTLSLLPPQLSDTQKQHLDPYLKITGILSEMNRTGVTAETRQKETQNIVQVIKGLAEAGENREGDSYLSALADTIASGHWQNPWLEWLDGAEREVDLILDGEDDRQGVGYFLVMNLAAESGQIMKYISLTAKMHRQSEEAQSRMVYDLALIPRIRVTDLVDASNFNHSMILLPRKPDFTRENSYTMIIFHNVIRLVFEHTASSLAKTVLIEPWAQHLEFEVFYGSRVIHRLAHYFAPIIQDPDSDRIESLTERQMAVFSLLEEIRADILLPANASLLVKEEWIDKEEKIFTVYLVDILLRYLGCETETARIPLLIQLNTLMEEGAINWNFPERKLSIHRDNFKLAIQKLALRIKLTKKASQLREIIKDTSDQIKPSEALSAVLDLCNTLAVRLKLNPSRSTR